MKVSDIVFDPIDPFPLMEVDSYTYEAAKIHSKNVDQWLGFNIEPIEKELRKQKLSQQTWSELDPQSFQTPYCEIRSLLQLLNLKNKDRVIDLGSAYNRMAFVMGRHYPQCEYVGYEIAETRVQHSQERISQWNYTNIQLQTANLTEISFPEAEHYFLYDFGHNRDIQNILEKLRLQSQKKSFQVVARGRACRHFIMNDHPWLHSPSKSQHFEHLSVFDSK